MNRYSECVQYLESKFNHNNDGFVLDKIGMTADEVRIAMKKYSQEKIEFEPVQKTKSRLTPTEKTELLQMLEKKFQVSEIAKKFGIAEKSVRNYRIKNRK